MNMRATLSDDQLLAQRQARTGRAVSTAAGHGAPTDPNGGAPAGPGLARPAVPARDPFNPSLPPVHIDTPDDGGAPPPVAPPAAPPVATPSIAELQAQLGAMQQQLSAALGRVAPLQQQAENFRSTSEALQAANAQLQAQLAEVQSANTQRAAAEAAANFDPFEGMSADELALLDPTVIDAMRRSARAALAKATAQWQDPRQIIAQTLQERDARALKAFITNASTDMQLVQLGQDVKFQEFLVADDSADMLLNSFVQAPDLETAQRLEGRVRKMLKRFREQPGAAPATPGGNQNPDPQDRLSAHLSRSGAPDAAPGAPGQQRKALTQEQVADIRRRAQALTRQRKFKDAEQLLAQLN